MARAGVVLPLWPGTPPNHKESELREIAWTDQVLRLRYVQTPTIEVFLAPSEIATGEAVIICPGGAYRHLSYEREGTQVAEWLNEKGIAGIVLKYRCPDDASNVEPWRTPLLDAHRAIRLSRTHAEEWDLNPHRIGVMGFSAGGHLAATTGVHFDRGNPEATNPVERESCRPDFLILVYPVISMRVEIGHSGSRLNLLGENPSPAQVDFYSTELQVTDETPPTFLVHADDDRGVSANNSLVFYAALREHGVPGELHVFQRGSHAFALARHVPGTRAWPDLCTVWLKELFAESASKR